MELREQLAEVIRVELRLADLAASTFNHLQIHLFENPVLKDKLSQHSPDAEKLKFLLRPTFIRHGLTKLLQEYKKLACRESLISQEL